MSVNSAEFFAEAIAIGSGTSALVRGVDIEISPGTTTAIVGESGSGKSLTARSLVGLLPSGLTSSGSVVLGDETYSLAGSGPETSAAWRNIRGSKITLLLQDPFTSLSPVHKIRTQVREALEHGGHRVTDDLMVERIAEVGLTKRVLRQYPHELSGGMRQRIALVLALAGDPAMLIADEPTTALDSLTQTEILSLIDTLKRTRGMSVLLISHDLDVVAGHADRVEVMWAGSIVERGTASDVLEHAVHPYTRGLLAATPRARTPVTSSIPWRVHPHVTIPDGARWGTYGEASDIRSGPKPTLVPLRGEGAGSGEHVVALYDVADDASAAVLVPHSAEQATVEFSDSESQARTENDPVVLQVRDLTFRHGRREILRDVSLDVRRGEILGLVGQSGSGKTTLARCIGGLEKVAPGTVTFVDEAGTGTRVQMVFQDPAGTLNPALTVQKTLTEAIRGVDRANQAHQGNRRNSTHGANRPLESPESLMKLVGLPEALLSRRPAVLSGGQRQRVAIARALASTPDLLVCDEAVSSLDVSVQAQILALLARLRDESGQTMLFISHDLAVIGQLCDRIAVLNEGKIVEHGVTAEVLQNPKADYTQKLVAASADVRVARPSHGLP